MCVLVTFQLMRITLSGEVKTVLALGCVVVVVVTSVGAAVEGAVVVAGAINCTVVDPRAVCFTHTQKQQQQSSNK